MIWFIVGLFVGGVVMTVVVSCFAYRNYRRGYADGTNDEIDRQYHERPDSLR